MPSVARLAGKGDRLMNGKVVLVTGAAGYLGQVLSTGFRERGAMLALVDVNEEGLTKVVQKLRDPGPDILTILGDLSHVSEADRIIAEVDAAFNRLDVLVNNAAVIIRTPIEDVTEVIFDTQCNINFRGTFFVSKAAVRLMQRNRWGRIVNISSIGARTGGVAGSAVYSATKAAIVALTKAFARSYVADGILVNCVAPGPMKTPMMDLPKDILDALISEIPMKRMAEPKEVAEIVFWLASEGNTYATGATFDINGGLLMW